MEDLELSSQFAERAGGRRQMAIMGVVASGQSGSPGGARPARTPNASVEIKTAATGSARVWKPSSPILSSAIRPADSNSPSMTAARGPTPCRFAWLRPCD